MALQHHLVDSTGHTAAVLDPAAAVPDIVILHGMLFTLPDQLIVQQSRIPPDARAHHGKLTERVAVIEQILLFYSVSGDLKQFRVGFEPNTVKRVDKFDRRTIASLSPGVAVFVKTENLFSVSLEYRNLSQMI